MREPTHATPSIHILSHRLSLLKVHPQRPIHNLGNAHPFRLGAPFPRGSRLWEELRRAPEHLDGEVRCFFRDVILATPRAVDCCLLPEMCGTVS
jgi:hypothetical protein